MSAARMLGSGAEPPEHVTVPTDSLVGRLDPAPAATTYSFYSRAFKTSRR